MVKTPSGGGPKVLDKIFTICYYCTRTIFDIMKTSAAQKVAFNSSNNLKLKIPIRTMKTTAKIVLAAMMVVFANCAQAQRMSAQMADRIFMSVNSHLYAGEAIISFDDYKGLVSTDPHDADRWIRKYTETREVKVASVQLADQKGDRLVSRPQMVRDTTMNVVFLQLEKFRREEHRGEEIPLYTFNPSEGGMPPAIAILDCTLGGVGQKQDVAQAAPAPSSAPVEKLVSEPERETQPTDQVVQQGGGHETSIEDDGITGYTNTPSGKLVPIYENTSQQGDQPEQQPAQVAPAPSDTRTASRTETVSVSGDQDLLADRGQKHASEEQSERDAWLEYVKDTKPELRTTEVNEIEREYLFEPPTRPGEKWTVSALDDNADMAIADMGRKRKILTTNQKPSAGSMRNAHKFGMGESAGYDDDKQYGHHGGSATKGDIVYVDACPGQGWAPYGSGGWQFMGGCPGPGYIWSGVSYSWEQPGSGYCSNDWRGGNSRYVQPLPGGQAQWNARQYAVIHHIPH